VLTANAVSGARDMFIKEGFDEFIAKPIELVEMTRVLKKMFLRGED
jgi:CheY-like chemotaxis protein